MKRFFFSALMIVFAAALQSSAAENPNIVLLFADDAGYGDFGFHKSHHFKTPHLDHLAERGVGH